MGKFKTAHLTIDSTGNVARKSKREKKKCAKIERMLVGYTGGSRVFCANENRFLSK